MNLGRRIEVGSGQIAYILAAVNGNKKAKPMDFMPHEKAATNDEVSSDNDVKDFFRKTFGAIEV